MDDILVWGDFSTPSHLKDQLIPSLSSLQFKIAPHKMYLILPIAFLRTQNFLTSICSLKPTLSFPQTLTLASLQRILENIVFDCFPPHLYPTVSLWSLVRDKISSSLRAFPSEAVEALGTINTDLKDVTLTRCDPRFP